MKPGERPLNQWEKLEKDRKQPPDAVYYDGFWLRPDEIKRLIEIQEFHLKYGNDVAFKPEQPEDQK